MSKHNQSASLGALSDFASSPATPDERLDRLDRLENRLENIEKLLNTVLFAVNDLNISFDKVSKTAETPAPAPKPKEKPKEKPKPKQQPAPQPKKQKGKASDSTSHFTDEQMAEINANKEAATALFADRESLTKAEAVELLDLDTKLIGRVLFVLVAEKFLTMNKPKPTDETPDPKVIFTRKQSTEV